MELSKNSLFHKLLNLALVLLGVLVVVDSNKKKLARIIFKTVGKALTSGHFLYNCVIVDCIDKGKLNRGNKLLFYLPANDSLAVTGEYHADFVHRFSAHGESF